MQDIVAASSLGKLDLLKRVAMGGKTKAATATEEMRTDSTTETGEVTVISAPLSKDDKMKEITDANMKRANLLTTIGKLAASGARLNAEIEKLAANSNHLNAKAMNRATKEADFAKMHGKLRGRHLGEIRCNGVRIFKLELPILVEIMA